MPAERVTWYVPSGSVEVAPLTAPPLSTVTVTPGSGVAAFIARPLMRQAPATAPCCASIGCIGPMTRVAAPSATASVFFIQKPLALRGRGGRLLNLR